MKPLLLYVVTEDWFFMIHRLPTLQAAQRAGFDVALVTRVGKQRKVIENLGIRIIDFPFDRKSRNPFTAFAQVRQLARVYATEKPLVVHHIALKPILFGSLAGKIARVPFVINGFVGLGTLFYSGTLFVRILRPILFPVLRFAAAQENVWTLFENNDDRESMLRGRMARPKRTVVVPGSGVDVARFQPSALPPSPPFICMFAGRMIAMKGLQTIRDAFAILRDTAPHVHLWLCGLPDPGNPESWTADMLRSWCDENPHVMWKGHQPDMALLWPRVHLALQPTIGGEGLPVALLEASSCARPMIATDVPGCRDVVEHQVNGLLIPERDPQALANAILRLAGDASCCAAMGREGRIRAEVRFSSAHVTEAVYTVYKTITQA